MHLALVISSLKVGGAERVLCELANYWASKGHSVSVITIQHRDQKPFYFLDPSINLIQLGNTTPPSLLIERLRITLLYLYRLRGNFKKLKPDYIISFMDLMNLASLTASRGLGVPVIISERTDPHFHPVSRLFCWLRLKLYPLCKKLVVQTTRVPGYFPSRFQNFIKIIPNAVKIPRIQKETLGEKVTHVVTVGRLEAQKDHRTLIQAFARLNPEYPDLALTIYGEGPERKSLEALIDELALREKVSLPGVTQDVYGELFKADLFIFLSHYEGFPNALCEAMAMGLPVIASNCSGNVEVVQDNIDGRLFPSGDLEALVRVMRELINDYPHRQRLARKASEVCTRFHPQAIFKLWDEIIGL